MGRRHRLLCCLWSILHDVTSFLFLFCLTTLALHNDRGLWSPTSIWLVNYDFDTMWRQAATINSRWRKFHIILWRRLRDICWTGNLLQSTSLLSACTSLAFTYLQVRAEDEGWDDKKQADSRCYLCIFTFSVPDMIWYSVCSQRATGKFTETGFQRFNIRERNTLCSWSEWHSKSQATKVRWINQTTFLREQG